MLVEYTHNNKVKICQVFYSTFHWLQYWNTLMSIMPGSLQILSKCSGFNEHIMKAIAVQSGKYLNASMNIHKS